jgi:WD40 repeat protein
VVTSAAFSPDGARIVTASADAMMFGDNTARLWDGVTGAEIAVLRGHESSVNSAAFSPDGARIVTASADTTARLWDGVTGAEIAVLRGHEGEVNSAAFSPDDTRIVTASSDKTARIWPHYKTMDALYDHACAIVQRLQPLSKTELGSYYLETAPCGAVR